MKLEAKLEAMKDMANLLSFNIDYIKKLFNGKHKDLNYVEKLELIEDFVTALYNEKDEIVK